MLRSGVVALLLFPLLGLSPAPASASAQPAVTLLVVRVSIAPGAAPAESLVELIPASGIGTARKVTLPADVGSSSQWVPGGEYLLRISRSAHRTVELPLYLEPGTTEVIEARLEIGGSSTESFATVNPRYSVAYQAALTSPQIDHLASANTAWALLETAHPFLVADRIDGGGIWTGDPATLGGQGTSPTQTTFEFDGVDVTDPLATGTPLLYPELGAFERIQIGTAGLDASVASPGPVIGFSARRAQARWTGSGSLAATPGGWGGDAGNIPPIARLESLADGGGYAGGPIAGGRSGLFSSGRVISARRLEREGPELEGAARSVLAHLVAVPQDDRQIRAFAAVNQTRHPVSYRARFADGQLEESDAAVLLHGTWEELSGGTAWSVDGGIQRRTNDTDAEVTTEGGTMERLRDGSPLSLVQPGDGHRQRWSVRGRADLAPRRLLSVEHMVSVGATAGTTGAAGEAGAQAPFGELVNGQPARVWDVGFRGSGPRWGSTYVNGFLADRFTIGEQLALSAGVRFDLDRGSAEGAAGAIRWFNVSPRLALRWQPSRDVPLGIISGYGWYRHRLPLGYFAAGDPAGPSGVTYRWDDRDGNRDFTDSELTPVAAIGGSASAGISDDLRRPTTREFHIGVEHAFAGWRWSIVGLDRREQDGVALVNVGVTEADYTISYVIDPGVDIAGLSGSAPLPIYNRRPESFGRDVLVLTNPSTAPARYQGVEISLRHDTGQRWIFGFGGSAYRSEGVGGNRGYRTDENDQGVLGEAFTTPNAQTFARGRLFSDRAYVMKVHGAYTAPGPLRLSAVARYQDGQPFARLVVADGLNQGTDIVQAYPRGGQRFTYTATVDARAELRWAFAGTRSLGLVLDAFNLLNMANEVEEDIVTGPSFRAVTAVQPPRVVRLGLRVGF